MLELKNINRVFTTQERRQGITGVLKDLLKPKFVQFSALQKINLSIKQGEKLGIVGKNGAGKSTLIKILTGILRPSSGDVLYNDQNLFENLELYKKNIGVMFGQRSQLYSNMILAESLEMLRLIYGLSRTEADFRLKNLSERLDLEELLKKPVREMSLGQKMRCEIAAVLLHKPKIIFLDEPTIGLDLEVKEKFYNLIKSCSISDNVSLIITSHDVKDIANLSDRLIILNEGKINADLPTADFINNFDTSKKLTLTFQNIINFQEKVFSDLQLIETNEKSKTACFMINKSLTIGDVLNLIEKKNDLCDIKIEEEDFAGVLLNYYRSGECS